jgi:eukaryotic-like serine/threonine-protein kinase
VAGNASTAEAAAAAKRRNRFIDESFREGEANGFTPQEPISPENLQPQLEIPRMRIGRYELERQLGHGGMASVYEARDTGLERAVAVKLLAENLAGDEELRKRFLREARLAARLSHPNVVNVFDAGEDGGRPYIVMELVRGETLAERGRVSPEEARDFALQAARGLAHAHEAGLVHRDIKPGNLLVRADGTLKIADFGIARAAEATALTKAGTVLGTAAYLAPEQALGEDVTPAADVYSLGGVFYELLTGRPPFEFDSLAELAEKQRAMAITPVRELAPDTPRDLEDLVMRCLARNPLYRPSAAELVRELEPAAPEPPTERMPRARLQERSTLWLALAGVLVLAAILLAVIAVAARDSGKPKPRPTPGVPSISRGSTPQEQARNIAAWLRRYSR